jgi:hypothetical protein
LQQIIPMRKIEKSKLKKRFTVSFCYVSTCSEPALTHP